MFVDFNHKKIKKTGVLILAATLLAVGGIGVVNSFYHEDASVNSEEAVLNCKNWGLSFQEEGTIPIGTDTKENLEKYRSYYCGDTGKKVLYLTFDAGYENGYTDKILDVLKEEKVPATFFVVGSYIKTNGEIVKRMVSENHIVGNHSMNHEDMSVMTDKNQCQKELAAVENLYRETTGKDMKKFFRPPQGKYSFELLKNADELGYQTIFWSLAYVDWYTDKQPTREEALSKLLPRTHNGGIILLHSTSKTNAQILKELITKWKEKGYEFKSIEDLSS